MIRNFWIAQIIAASTMVIICIAAGSSFVFLNLGALAFGVVMLASIKEPTP